MKQTVEETDSIIEIVINEEDILSDEEHEKVINAIGSVNATIAKIYDIFIVVKDKDNNEIGRITELSEEIGFKMALPEDATTVDEGTTREYSVVREHDGYEVINSILSENGLNILFKSDKFSKFIISYVDTALQPSPEPSVEPSPEPSVEPSAIPTPEQKNEDSKAVGSNPITSDDIVIWMIIFGITTIAYIIINKKDKKGKRAK